MGIVGIMKRVDSEGVIDGEESQTMMMSMTIDILDHHRHLGLMMKKSDPEEEIITTNKARTTEITTVEKITAKKHLTMITLMTMKNLKRKQRGFSGGDNKELYATKLPHPFLL